MIKIDVCFPSITPCTGVYVQLSFFKLFNSNFFFYWSLQWSSLALLIKYFYEYESVEVVN